MPDLAFLFAPPNIEKLKANKDTAGLTKALTYTRDASIPRAAAAALLSLNAYQPASESLVRQGGGTATTERLETVLLALVEQPSTDALVRVKAAQALVGSLNEQRFKAVLPVLLAEGKFDWLHEELEKSGQAERIQSMRTLAEQTYAQESSSLRQYAWAAGYLLRWQDEPYAAFLLENYQTLFTRLRSLFTYEDVIKASVPWCEAGNLVEPYQAFFACVRGLAHLPTRLFGLLKPLLENENDYMVRWTVYIVGEMSGSTAASTLAHVLMTQPNLDIRNRAYWSLTLGGWKPGSMDERLACVIASGDPWGRDEMEALGIGAIPAIESALKMRMKTGGREMDGRQKRDVYFELRSVLEILKRKAQNQN